MQRYTWYGYLTDENVDEVAERIRNLLTNRKYTVVTSNAEMKHSAPEVRTSQTLSDGVTVHHFDDVAEDGEPRGFASVSFPDKNYTCSITTRFRTVEDAVKADDASNTYVLIEGGRGSDDIGRRSRIQIKQYNFMSPPELLHWVIVPENPEGN